MQNRMGAAQQNLVPKVIGMNVAPKPPPRLQQASVPVAQQQQQRRTSMEQDNMRVSAAPELVTQVKACTNPSSRKSCPSPYPTR
jgi:hypothetical protein